MGCKADGVDEYRSNLMVVRISSRRPTQQTAFQAPRYLANATERVSLITVIFTCPG